MRHAFIQPRTLMEHGKKFSVKRRRGTCESPIAMFWILFAQVPETTLERLAEARMPSLMPSCIFSRMSCLCSCMYPFFPNSLVKDSGLSHVMRSLAALAPTQDYVLRTSLIHAFMVVVCRIGYPGCRKSSGFYLFNQKRGSRLCCSFMHVCRILHFMAELHMCCAGR